MSDITPITREEALLDGQDLTPITRKEQFIKRIYDPTQVIPEPATREEWFLKKAGDGSSPVTIEALSVTENGTYSEAGKAYSPVTVNVPEPRLITKSITANGTYTASDDNADGYSIVTVAVEGFKKKSIANTPTDIASFNDGTANPMPSLEISIEPQQDLNGYEYPWVGGAGKNKLKVTVTSQTIAGITVTVKDDGTFIANGTATQNISFQLSRKSVNDTPLPEGQLIMTGCPSGGSTSSYYLTCWRTNSGNANDVGNGTTFSYQSDLDFVVSLVITSGTVCNNLTFKPMIRLESVTDAAFEPYSNICPISGHTEANVTVTDDLTTPTETYTLSIPFHDSSDNPITVYGGMLNVTSRELTATHANIASYNGETINEPWISSMDVYSAGATPTTGAQVVYPLTTPQTYQLTPTQVVTLLGQNNIFADCGQILEGEYFVAL